MNETIPLCYKKPKFFKENINQLMLAIIFLIVFEYLANLLRL